ncbi:MAG: 23S rRNA (adenine(2503)-C(2))-methyltransferase RlmN [Luteitalea sp.]|nr:23S rRNA (adenine(2503)-C(2))-methyltransferase RlmN [Luteitalea sp.]
MTHSKDGRTDVAELELPQLEALLSALGVAPFHARQLYRWVYRKGVTDFADMTDLSRTLRTQLSAACYVSTPHVIRTEVSVDGTTKFLLRLVDGRDIEAVYIPDTPSQTFCISTQAGCAMRCAFCLTGKMGLVRHLSAGEIAGQARVLARELGMLERAFNIVLMGMGEPLHNYDHTMKALRMLSAREGLAVPPRRVTLSTVGLVPAIERLASEPLIPNLAISLHATTEAQRSELVPINDKYSLASLVEACKRLPLGRRRRITFEYVLLEGVNDTTDDARRLGTLVSSLEAKVNLLPLNEAPGIPFCRPSEARVDAFARTLAARGVTVSVRKSRGRDIRAACGQLIVEGQRRSPGQRLAAHIGANQ